MTYMLNGTVMSGLITQDLQLGALGRFRQDRLTYVVDTTVTGDVSAVLVNRGDVSDEELQCIVDEYEQRHGVDWGGIVDVADKVKTLVETTVQLISQTAPPGPVTVIIYWDGMFDWLPRSMRPDDWQMMDEGLRVEAQGAPDALLDLGLETFLFQPVWDEDAYGYKLVIDEATRDKLEGLDMTLSFASPFDSSETFGWRLLDDQGALIGEESLSLANVPEPTSLAMMTLGGLALLRRRRAA